jgi:hypothetical protein
MYKTGEVTMEPGGWFIEILAPDGFCICSLWVDANIRAHNAEALLREDAAGLLSHLNR